MKIKKLLLKCIVALVIVTGSLVPVSAKELSWKIQDGTLTISGNGEMDNYGDKNLSPWYSNREDIQKVVIKSGVTSIGQTAFYNLPNLLSVEIADSVTSIGDYAFLECVSLKSVKMSSKVKYIGEAAFKQCSSLSSIELPNVLESIGYEAFFLCEGLKSITVPSSVKEMEECVFTYCHGLVTANIYANIDSLPYWTFYDCESLVSLNLSSSIVSIGTKAVYDCNSLTHVKSDADDKTADQIEKEIKKQTSSVNDVTTNTGNSQETHVSTNNGDIYQEVIENDDVVISGAITDTQVKVDIVVNDKDGWDDISENVDKYVGIDQQLDYKDKMNVTIQTNDDMNVPGKVISSLAGKDANLVLKGNTYQVTISCDNLVAGKKYGDLNFKYSLEKIDNPGNSIKKVIGNSNAYLLQFKSSCDIPVTVDVDFGSLYGQQFASIFQKDFSSYDYLQTVRMDAQGIASFYLANFDSLTTYLIGINVDEKYTQAIIPDNEYNGLTDAYGNKYEITGMESKWGLTITQVMLIMAAIMVAVIAAVGGGMYMMNKRKIENERIRKEVMSENYKFPSIRKFKK